MKLHQDVATGHRIVYHDLATPDSQTPPIVCVHGLGTSGMASFASLLPYEPFLRQRTLVIDLPGFGLSDKPTEFSYGMEEQARMLADLLDAAEARGTLLVGHSMGGAIAIRMAFDRPDLVSRLIVAEGNLDPEPGLISGAIAAQDEASFVSLGCRRLAERIRADGGHGYLASYLVASPVALHRSAVSLIAPRAPTFREMLYAVEMPRIYLFGEKTLPDPDKQRLADDGVRVAVVPGAGHDMMNGNPAAFAAVVRAEAEALRAATSRGSL